MSTIKLGADSGGGSVALKGPASTTSNAAVQLTLPVDDGTANQVLKTDGNGALAWVAQTTDTNTDTVYDDSNLRKDLNTLALQTAVDTNRKAYNLTNSFIDQFEDSTGIGTTTSTTRSTDEYVSSSDVVATAFNFGTAGTHGQPALLGLSHKSTAVQSNTSGNWSGDSVYINNSNAYKSCAWPNFVFDTKTDWTHYVNQYVSHPGASVGERGNSAQCVIIWEDTDLLAGKNPVDSSDNSIFRAHGHSTDDSISPYQIEQTNVDDLIFTSTYATRIGTSSWNAPSSATGGDSTTTYDYSSVAAGSGVQRGAIFRASWTANSDNECGSIQVRYDESESKIQMQFGGSGDTAHATCVNINITNVPDNARVICLSGIDNQSSVDRLHSISRGGSPESNGYITTGSTNATGTVIGTANTASSSRTKVSGTFLYKNNAGTATIGTDLKIYFTCNGGTNWTEAASYTVGSDFSTGIKTIYLGETTCTAGTDVRYKAVWANQSATKETQLHGIGVNY